MHILLCLLSEQHIPNLLAVKHFRPDKLVLIETIGMKKKKAAENFLRALNAGGDDYSDRKEIFTIEREDDFREIKSCLKRAYSSFPTDRWTAVLTGGTKPMSICTYDFFKAIDQKCVYTGISTPDIINDVNTGENERCTYGISIGEFLEGYGFKIKNSGSERENIDREWWELSRIIAQEVQSAVSDPVIKLSDEERKTAREKGIEIKPGMITEGIIGDAVAGTFGLSRVNSGIEGKIDKYQARFLTGGWLEVFIWGLLDKHKEKLRIYDIRLGLEVMAREASTSNEFDVCFMRDYSLSMVECKSGGQEYDREGDILHKTEALIRQFRALRVKTYLVTTGRNILDGSGNIKKNILDRAAIYNCTLITVNDIVSLAKNHEDADVVEGVFFKKKPH